MYRHKTIDIPIHRYHIGHLWQLARRETCERTHFDECNLPRVQLGLPAAFGPLTEPTFHMVCSNTIQNDSDRTYFVA